MEMVETTEMKTTEMKTTEIAGMKMVRLVDVMTTTTILLLPLCARDLGRLGPAKLLAVSQISIYVLGISYHFSIFLPILSMPIQAHLYL